MKDSHDVGPVLFKGNIVVSEHYDSVPIFCLCMVSLPGPWGSLFCWARMPCMVLHLFIVYK